MTRILGAGGSGGCFLGHTLVRVPSGQRRISELKPGDPVISFDDRGELHEAAILAVHEHEGEQVNRYTLWGGAVLDATPNHWVLNQFNAFVEIDTIGPDDCLVDENNHLRPIVSRSNLCTGTVYNLTVEGHHTFIAGGIRVHNAGLGLGAIAGAGGGGSTKGSGGRKPQETGDNLDSRQYAKLIDLISEGEIEGIKGGLQGIYLNNTPLQNPNGSLNFSDVQVSVRNGTQSQSAIPGFGEIADERPVGVTVYQPTPVVRTITDPNVDAVRITISIPQLQWFQNDGDIRGSSTHVTVYIQYNGGGYQLAVSDVISGRTADLFQKDYIVNISGAFPVDVKVARANPDSNSSRVINAFAWASYTEIIYAKLRYPNSALVGIRIDAEQFSSIPSRSYLIRGIKVRIPNNATVDQNNGRLVYSGVWGGTLGAAQWCSDPAWILWDLLTSTRYGFGDHIDTTQLDKWAFYAASQYSSTLVPNGFGGWEPRFSCNINIQTSEDAYKLINDMCSVFRCMPYWSTGTLTISQDKPADPAYLFTLANVSQEGFSYSGSSRKVRPTVAVVSYLDLTQRDIAYESVEDLEGIAKYGVVKTEISAFACTSRGQAARIGEWLLYSERYESEVISFTASIDAGVVVRPGQVIEVSDPMRSGARRGGRIRSATASSVTVDDATGLTYAAGSQLSVVLPDGTMQTKAVTDISGDIISVAVPFSAAPNANSVWVYQTSDLLTSTWRVLSVQEQDGSQYAVTALAYNASKYAAIESGRALQVRDVTNLNVIPPPPINLTYEELIYEDQGAAVTKLIISWQIVPGVAQYRVRWRFEDGNWTNDTVQRPDYEIRNTQSGRYEVQVYSLSAALLPSTQPASLTISAAGKTAPPFAPTNVSLVPIDEASAILSWDRSLELDVLLGGKVLIRHSVLMVSAVWEESQEIVAAAAGSQTQKQVPLLEGTYLLKFEDDGGRRSLTSTNVVVDLPTPQPRFLLQSYAEDLEAPPFNGNYTDMLYVSNVAELDGAAGILLSTGLAVDEMAPEGDWDALVSIDSVGGVLPIGEYEFGSTYSLNGVYDVNLRRRIASQPYIPGDFWDDKLDDIDTWDLIDGTGGDRVNALTYVRTTEDDPSATPVWGDWREFSNAIVRGRGFQFKTIATSSDPTQNIVVTQLGAELELQQRTASAGPFTSGAGAYAVTFEDPFYQAPAVGVTAYNMGTGDYFTMSGVSRTGFTVTFFSAAAAAVSRSFTYTAVGFGREI